MKIMTFNIQHCYNQILKKIDYEEIVSLIKEEDPDILGINEIYGEDEASLYGNQVKKIAELSGYKYFYFAKAFEHFKGAYGNALLSKIPILKAETVVIPEPFIKLNQNGYYEPRCLLIAELSNGKKIIVTHFGLNEDEVYNEIDVLLEHLNEHNCILMGDFNNTPNQQMLNPIKNKMKDTTTDYGENSFTWPSDEPRCKIDYIFVSFDINVKQSCVIKKIVSDHLALLTIIYD